MSFEDRNTDSMPIGGYNLASELIARAVQDQYLVARAKPQNVKRVVSFAVL